MIRSFQVSWHYQIEVNFDYLRLDCHADVTLIIRDGVTAYSPLMQIINGQTKMPLVSAMTTTSRIFMELNSSHVAEDNEFPQCVTGFIVGLRVGKFTAISITIILIVTFFSNLKYTRDKLQW